MQLEGVRIYRNQTLEDYDSPMGEVLSNVAEDTWITNPMSSAARIAELTQAQYGGYVPGSKGGEFADPKTRLVPEEEAVRRMGDAGVKVDVLGGITDEALNIKIERKREEIKRRAVIESAPDGFWAGTAKFGTGLAVSMADPLNIAASFVPVIAPIKYGKMLQQATTAAARTGVRAKVGALEGAVGALLVEPIVLGAAMQEDSEYGLYDSLLNVTFGTVMGGGLHSVGGAIGDAVSKSSSNVKQDLLNSAIAQAVDEKPINVSYVAQSHIDLIETLKTEGGEIQIRSIREELTPVARNRLPDAEKVKLDQESRELDLRLSKLNEERKSIESQKAIRLKKQGIKKSERLAEIDADQASIRERQGIVEQRVRTDERARKAQEDLDRLEQGIIPDKYKARITEPEEFNYTANKEELSPLADPAARDMEVEDYELEVDVLERETKDILDSVDDEFVRVEAENIITAINRETEREANGLQAAILCRMGNG